MFLMLPTRRGFLDFISHHFLLICPPRVPWLLLTLRVLVLEAFIIIIVIFLMDALGFFYGDDYAVPNTVGFIFSFSVSLIFISRSHRKLGRDLCRDVSQRGGSRRAASSGFWS